MRAFTSYKIAALCLITAPVWAATGSTASRAASDGQRYPYDPVCGWGRIADGHGMLMRCLTRDEAAILGAPATKPAPATAVTAEATAPKATETEGGSAKSSASEVAVTGEKPKAQPEPPAPVVSKLDLVVEKIGPIVVDTGDLPLAVKKLSGPKDRYLECVKKNGGISAERAEVEVRFLVRERGRAEGVSVAKRKGMSEQAAKCIADVVDRRYVGYPEAPIVGATLPFTIGSKK